jgi:hypothetical protein
VRMCKCEGVQIKKYTYLQDMNTQVKKLKFYIINKYLKSF